MNYITCGTQRDKYSNDDCTSFHMECVYYGYFEDPLTDIYDRPVQSFVTYCNPQYTPMDPCNSTALCTHTPPHPTPPHPAHLTHMKRGVGEGGELTWVREGCSDVTYDCHDGQEVSEESSK